MKILIILFFSFTAFSGFSQSFLLADDDSNKNMLSDFIQKSIEENTINKNLVIVVNDQILSKSELETFSFYKSDIINFFLIEKNNNEAVDIYGKQALNGVLMIETKPLKEKTFKSITDSKVLYLLNNKPITKEDLENINPDEIESVNVIKDKNSIKNYTLETFDGVVIIKLKKS